MRDFILNILFPIECVGCSKEGGWICESCLNTIPFNSSRYCFSCKQKNNYGEFCRNCAPNFFLNGVWIAGNYDNPLLAKLIKNLKYRGAENIAVILGNYLSRFMQGLLDKNRLTGSDLYKTEVWRRFHKVKQAPPILLDFNNTIIIPVPLHKKRQRLRGFNQSEQLARVINKNFNLEINHNLIRIKHKKAQAKLHEKNRWENIKNCFSYQGKNLNNKNILLIDDVATTGATLNECARVLKENNAKEVWGLVVAKG